MSNQKQANHRETEGTEESGRCGKADPGPFLSSVASVPRWLNRLEERLLGSVFWAPSINRSGQTSKIGVIALLLCLLTPHWASAATMPTDPTRLQCGNLVYCGNKSSVCFADRFLTDVARQTNLRVTTNFCPVKLDSDALFDYPFCVMSGNETFTLSQRERDNLKKYLMNGGFLLASPGCSDEKWDRAFRQELKISFPEYALTKIPMKHPIFSVVHEIPRLTDKHGKQVMLEGLEINGRLVLVYSSEGLNDVEHAKGCCCCGGNEIVNPVRVNVNVFTYALLY